MLDTNQKKKRKFSTKDLSQKRKKEQFLDKISEINSYCLLWNSGICDNETE